MNLEKVAVQLKDLSIDNDLQTGIVGFVEVYQEDTAIIQGEPCSD